MAFINLSDQSNELPGRRYQETLSTGAEGTWLVLDSVDKGDDLTASLSITSGEGYIEYTNEDVASVINDTANAVKWALGNVTATSYACFGSAMTAVRPVRVSGTIKFSGSV